MRNRLLITSAVILVLTVIRLLASAPGSTREAFLRPLKTLFGQSTQSRRLDVPESPDSIRAASQRLLKPFGVVRLVQIYDSQDAESSKKEDPLP